MSRHVCKFSCGAASAVAAKIIVAEGHSNTIVVNAFIAEEHADNQRFALDVERWLGMPIIRLQDQQYGASTLEVFRRVRFIKGPNGAPCSRKLKRKVLAEIALPGDVSVVGFTAEETDRFDSLCEGFPREQFRAPLIEAGLSKGDCFAILERAGIQLPAMYRLGYQNANCIGCPKGGQAYWQAIRADFPARFEEMVAIQDELGPGASFLRFRSGPRAEQRMSLRDLPPGRGDLTREPSFSCSFFCALVEQNWKEAV